MTDNASRIVQDGRQRANDLADVAAELALGVPEQGRLQQADRARPLVARNRFGNEVRGGARHKAETMRDVLETLARAVSGLQGNDGAADRLGDLSGAAAGKNGELAAV